MKIPPKFKEWKTFKMRKGRKPEYWKEWSEKDGARGSTNMECFLKEKF